MYRILFDTNEIDGDRIVSLNQSVQPFANSFRAGVTVCREFDLEIVRDSNGSVTIPNKVYIYDGNTLYATLLVDSYDDKNKRNVSYVLTDMMIRFNKKLVYEEGLTVKQILQQICSDHNITLVSQSFYMSDQVINWISDDVTERDFISYVAEVNGGYAYINASGNLVIEGYSNTSHHSVAARDCSEVIVGAQHKIGRVYVELAEATHYYPEATDDDTLYINSSNILLADSGDYTIQDIIEHIYDVVNGFEFYDVTVSRCPIDKNVRACQIITIDSHPTICTIDWKFNKDFYGGYSLELETQMQAETRVSGSVDAKIKKLAITVDRELGLIDQRIEAQEETIDGIETEITTVQQREDSIVQTVSNLQTQIVDAADAVEKRVMSNVTTIEQTANSVSLRATQLEQDIADAEERIEKVETAVDVRTDGVRISQGTEGSYTLITDEGMDIYSNGQKAAWVNDDGFNAKEYLTQDWHIKAENGGRTLNFFRKV